jgi:hypothetical protein
MSTEWGNEWGLEEGTEESAEWGGEDKWGEDKWASDNDLELTPVRSAKTQHLNDQCGSAPIGLLGKRFGRRCRRSGGEELAG